MCVLMAALKVAVKLGSVRNTLQPVGALAAPDGFAVLLASPARPDLMVLLDVSVDGDVRRVGAVALPAPDTEPVR